MGAGGDDQQQPARCGGDEEVVGVQERGEVGRPGRVADHSGDPTCDLAVAGFTQLADALGC